RAIEVAYPGSANDFIGNVVGSAEMQSMKGYNLPVVQRASVEYPSTRSYDAVAFGWSFGFGMTSDDGTGTGCAGGVPPCHLAGSAARNLLHGNFNNIGG